MATAEFLKDAMDAWRMSDTAESTLRQNMLSDMRFRATKDFWPSDIEADRIRDGRPVLKINELPQYIKQITNQERASRPGIQVNPQDSGADPKTAIALQGIVRMIETNSNADVAISTAADHQVTMGRGIIRVTTEYTHDRSFEQDIRIRRVTDPFGVFLDPTIEELDGSDAEFAHHVIDLTKNRFISRFGEDSFRAYTNFMSTSSRLPSWAMGGCYRISAYYYKKTDRIKIVEVEYPDYINGQLQMSRVVMRKADLTEPLPDSWRVIEERDTTEDRVYYALITPCEVLSGNDARTEGRPFPCRYIPFVPVIGDEIRVDGEVDYRGIVRDAQSPTKMKTYWLSSLTEIIGQAPRAPYIGFEGQFKGHEAKWRMANRKNYPYLEVVPMTIGGTPAGFPQRQQYEPAIQAVTTAFQIADQVNKGVIGMYEPSLGQQGPEQSGRAILARQRRGDIGTSNFGENLGISIRHVGRICVDMIPRVYAPGRVLKILGVNEKPEAILVHGGLSKDEAARLAQGVDGIYDLSLGRYDVSISTGPSLPSRRAEAVEAMLQLVQAKPEMIQVMGDLLVKNMDWPGAAEIAERIRRTIPAHILGDTEIPEGLPPEVQDMVRELQQRAEQAEQANAVKFKDIESKERIATAKITSDQQIADIGAKVDIMIAKLKADTEKTKLQMDAFLKRLEQQMQMHQTQAEREHESRIAAAELDDAAADRQQQREDNEADRVVAREKNSAAVSRKSTGRPKEK